MAMPVVLRSGRLRLRLHSAADLDEVHAVFSSDGHTIGDGPITDPAETLEWLHRRTLRHEESGLAWYGLWDHKDVFVGTCGTFIGRCGDEPEMGYEIAVPRRGVGYAAEALEVVTDAAHAAGHSRIWATIRPANVASVRTALTNGYLMARSEPDAKGALDYYVHSVATSSH
jgi:[ribosomal protein S5]-alanine N-acetyltransferase